MIVNSGTSNLKVAKQPPATQRLFMATASAFRKAGWPTMTMWVHHLKVDPLPTLQASDNEALQYFVRRDLLGEEVGPVDSLWKLPGAAKILKKQREGGSDARGRRSEGGAPWRVVEQWV